VVTLLVSAVSGKGVVVIAERLGLEPDVVSNIGNVAHEFLGPSPVEKNGSPEPSLFVEEPVDIRDGVVGDFSTLMVVVVVVHSGVVRVIMSGSTMVGEGRRCCNGRDSDNGDRCEFDHCYAFE
jgi:hypothetical protein